MRVFVEGVGILGPGLPGWEESRPILTGAAPFRPAPAAVAASELLPAAERRRTPVPVKLALGVGQEAFRNADRDMSTTATVFTSSSGEGETLHHMCETLASAEREVSPTRFHNSVHNAAAGYWSIATRCQEASTSLCAYDASFGAGLLEAAVQALAGAKPVALIAYDQPYPEPLHSARPILGCFGVAILLSSEPGSRARTCFDLTLLATGAPATRMVDTGLEEMRRGIPAARALPLLAAIARETTESVLIEFPEDSRLSVGVARC